MRDLPPTDESERRDILNAVGNFGKLAMEVVDVGLEIVILPYFDEEKMVIVLLGFPAGDVLSEECLGYLLKVVKRM